PRSRKCSRAHATWKLFACSWKGTPAARAMVVTLDVVICRQSSARCWVSKKTAERFTSVDNNKNKMFRFLLKGLNPFIFMWNYIRYSAHLDAYSRMSEPEPYD